MVDIDDFFKLYDDEYLPAYSDLVAYISDKPVNMLLDIEPTFRSNTFNSRNNQLTSI